jgi:hypothetical protein
VRLIAALDENIPCWLEKHDKARRIAASTRKLDRPIELFGTKSAFSEREAIGTR